MSEDQKQKGNTTNCHTGSPDHADPSDRARHIDRDVNRLSRVLTVAPSDRDLIALSLRLHEALREGIYREFGFSAFQTWAKKRHKLPSRTAFRYAKIGKWILSLPDNLRHEAVRLGCRKAAAASRWNIDWRDPEVGPQALIRAKKGLATTLEQTTAIPGEDEWGEVRIRFLISGF